MEAEDKVRESFKFSSQGMNSFVEKIEERPSLLRKKNNPIIKELKNISSEWNIPFGVESSLLATAAGEVPRDIPVVCGIAPASKGLYTPNEAIHRQELVQRTLLLALYLKGQET